MQKAWEIVTRVTSGTYNHPSNQKLKAGKAWERGYKIMEPFRDHSRNRSLERSRDRSQDRSLEHSRDRSRDRSLERS